MKPGFFAFGLAAMLLAGCGRQAPPVIINRGPDGIDMKAGIAVDTMITASLHCQYFGKLAVPQGIERVGNDQAIWHYACQ